jgi:hypothetical protein
MTGDRNIPDYLTRADDVWGYNTLITKNKKIWLLILCFWFFILVKTIGIT